MTKDELKLAFQKAFQMGQDYWYHADHEFESYNKKSDAIRAKFNEMVEETIKEALAQPEPPPECQTEAEKTAFAFGWFKAMESQRMAQPEQKRPPNCGTGYCSCIECVMEPEQKPAQEPVMIWYMRDNHTFKRLSTDVSTAMIEIEHEFNEGWTHGSLCSKREGFPMLHASGEKSRLEFFAACEKALEEWLPNTTPPQRTWVVFPTMLRKMWSGSEVQAWLDENVNKENT